MPRNSRVMRLELHDKSISSDFGTVGGVSSEDEEDHLGPDMNCQKCKLQTDNFSENIKSLRHSKQMYLASFRRPCETVKVTVEDPRVDVAVKKKTKRKTQHKRKKLRKRLANADAVTTQQISLAREETVPETETANVEIPEKDPEILVKMESDEPADENFTPSTNDENCLPYPINHHLHSDIVPNKHSYCHFLTDDTVIMVLKHPGVLCLKGKITLRSVKGCAEILGWHLKQGAGFLEVCQAGKDALVIETKDPACCGQNGGSKMTELLEAEGCPRDLAEEIKGSSVPEDVIVICKKMESKIWTYVSHFCPTVFRPLGRESRFVSWGCEFIELDKFYFLRISHEMVALAEDVAKMAKSAGGPPRVVVCGGKGLGKSTLLRYLVNSTLNTSEKICYLDCDPGQAMFTPTGLVSLVTLTKPILSPAFMCQRTPLMSHFVGDSSVSAAPSHYGACVENLIDIYRNDPELAELPLFVNTMGWVEGIGLALLCNNIAAVNPTHVAQLNTTVFSKKKNTVPLNAEYVSECAHREHSAGSNLYKYVEITSLVNSIDIYMTAAISREIGLVAHFADAQPVPGEIVPLRKCRTYKVPWKTVAVYACGAVVANSDILFALNGSMVALGKCENEDMTVSRFGYPRFLRSMPICECYGYGFIRGIDPVDKLYYVITALPPDTLAHVNTFIKGHLAIAPKMIFERRSECYALPYCQRVNDPNNASFGMGLRMRKPKYGKKRMAKRKRV